MAQSSLEEYFIIVIIFKSECEISALILSITNFIHMNVF